MIETVSPDHAGSRQPASYLFVPGNRPDRFAKAVASGADNIIIDLEDAIGPDDKDRARAAAVDWFVQGGAGVLRINGADTPWFGPDLAALAGCPQAVVMVPKANVAALNEVSRHLPGRPLIATLLHGLAARCRSDVPLRRFTFRATAPLFVDRPFRLEAAPLDGDSALSLWARGPDGELAMQAEAHFDD